MNYNKIYDSFIANRRAKELNISASEYTEIHHIIPKCLGGSDEKENLIRLTPEDHFFAHLLLAKIKGGSLWIAVGMMLGLKNAKRNTISYNNFIRKRNGYGFIRRSIASNFRKTNLNRTIHLLTNSENQVLIGDRDKLHSVIGGARERISAVVRGDRRSVKGWYSPIFNPKGNVGVQKREKASRYDSQIYKFQFIKTGEIIHATKLEIRNKFNLGSNVYSLFSGNKGSVKGLRLIKSD